MMQDKERAGGTVTIREAIKLAVADMLMAGSSAPKMYVRVRPDGRVDIAEENGWTCSEDEYYKRVPHTLSLEIPAGVRDYRNLSDGEIEECVDARFEATDQLLEGWDATIDAWLEAGNLAAFTSAETKLDTDVTVTCSACGHQTTAHTHPMPRPTPLPVKYVVSCGLEPATSHPSLDAAMRVADRLRLAYPDTRILIHRYNADGSNPLLVYRDGLTPDGLRATVS